MDKIDNAKLVPNENCEMYKCQKRLRRDYKQT
jgi:hypothetical protein